MRRREHGLVIGLENEPACNIGTARESARVLAALDHPALQLVWDPANAFVLGERPFPDGYGILPVDRIAHVHAKDCRVHDLIPEWGLLGDMGLDWRGQMDALLRDHYRGWVSLETHWRGPDGNRLEASRLCGERLRDLVREASRRAGRKREVDHMATSEATVVHRSASALDGVTPYHWLVVIIASCWLAVRLHGPAPFRARPRVRAH